MIVSSSLLKRSLNIVYTVFLAFLFFSVSALFPISYHEHGAKERAQSAFGPYLAGRFARANRETQIAADFYKRALDRDPRNERILEEAFFLETTAANWRRAEKLARKVVKKHPTHVLAQTFLGVHAFKQGRYKEADKRMSVKMRGPIAELTANLARAWTLYARGQTTRALKLLEKPGQAEWVTFYKQYHRGLIADLAGKEALANTSFAAIFDKDPRALRVASTYARFAARAGKMDLAEKILQDNIAKAGERPESKVLLAAIKAKEVPPRLIRTPIEGLAEVFYGFGDALTAENGVDMATVYLQIALYLRPDFPAAFQSLASAYEAIAQNYEKADKAKDLVSPKYQLAIEAYKKIPKSHPNWANVQIRKAYNLNLLDKVEEAKTILENIARLEPKNIRPLDALGDILRSHKRFEEASKFYMRAVNLVEKPEKEHWTLFYSLGVCYERMKQWPKAEKNLQKALLLNPDQPLVLNYLGYSWIDQNIHLDKAMKLIRKAVSLKPDDGYFVDSLGWAYYRQNKFEEATRELEKAVELRPDDPVINDHLGDAYWQVGRRNEAKFQWSQALTLKPEPEEIVKIKQKLKVGLIDENGPKTVLEKTEEKSGVKR